MRALLRAFFGPHPPDEPGYLSYWATRYWVLRAEREGWR